MAKYGRREYVQVLRLLEGLELADMQPAVKQVLQLGAIGLTPSQRDVFTLPDQPNGEDFVLIKA